MPGCQRCIFLGRKVHELSFENKRLETKSARLRFERDEAEQNVQDLQASLNVQSHRKPQVREMPPIDVSTPSFVPKDGVSQPGPFVDQVPSLTPNVRTVQSSSPIPPLNLNFGGEGSYPLEQPSQFPHLRNSVSYQGGGNSVFQTPMRRSRYERDVGPCSFADSYGAGMGMAGNDFSHKSPESFGHQNNKRMEKLNFGEYPSVSQFTQWRRKVKMEVECACEDSRTCLLWLNEIEDPQMAFDSLAAVPPGSSWDNLDRRILQSAYRLCRGDLALKIGTMMDAAAAKGNRLSGRQILRTIYDEFSGSMAHAQQNTVSQLQLLRCGRGVQGMSKYLVRWEELMNRLQTPVSADVKATWLTQAIADSGELRLEMNLLKSEIIAQHDRGIIDHEWHMSRLLALMRAHIRAQKMLDNDSANLRQYNNESRRDVAMVSQLSPRRKSPRSPRSKGKGKGKKGPRPASPAAPAPTSNGLDCFQWTRKGVCSFGKGCKYRHDPARKGKGSRPNSPNPGATKGGFSKPTDREGKTIVCRMFGSPKGCRFGSKCKFAHVTGSHVSIDEAELPAMIAFPTFDQSGTASDETHFAKRRCVSGQSSVAQKPSSFSNLHLPLLPLGRSRQVQARWYRKTGDSGGSPGGTTGRPPVPSICAQGAPCTNRLKVVPLGSDRPARLQVSVGQAFHAPLVQARLAGQSFSKPNGLETVQSKLPSPGNRNHVQATGERIEQFGNDNMNCSAMNFRTADQFRSKTKCSAKNCRTADHYRSKEFCSAKELCTADSKESNNGNDQVYIVKSEAESYVACPVRNELQVNAETNGRNYGCGCLRKDGLLHRQARKRGQVTFNPKVTIVSFLAVGVLLKKVGRRAAITKFRKSDSAKFQVTEKEVSRSLAIARSQAQALRREVSKDLGVACPVWANQWIIDTGSGHRLMSADSVRKGATV